MLRRVIGAAAITAVMSLSASAQELKWGLQSELTSLDPHFSRQGTNKALARHIFDALILPDQNMRPQPGLALSWEPLNDLVWEVKLRPDVKFHDGSDFTAEDVIFSYERVETIVNSPSPYTVFTANIDRLEVIDGYTIRIHTREPYPLLPQAMGEIYIVSSESEEAGEQNGHQSLVGTGPYVLDSYSPGQSIRLTRSDNYWGDVPEVESVRFDILRNTASRLAALLSGDVDIIENPSSADHARLKEDPKFELLSTVSYRIIYVGLDQESDTAPQGVSGTDGKNPFKDQRVREAMSIAINRHAISQRIMQGASTPATQLLPPPFYEHDDTIPDNIYDPERAKALLSEAGYPNGFSVTISATNDRYVNDAMLAQAIASNLSQVGIKTEVNVMPGNVGIPKIANREFGMFLIGAGQSTGEGTYGLGNLVASYDPDKGRGLSNHSRYSNPELDALIQTASSTVDEEKRTTMVRDIVKAAMADVAFIPIHWEHTSWAMRRGVVYKGRIDQFNLATDVTFQSE